MSNVASLTVNEQRSLATRKLLVDAALDCLVDVGFSRTTGVEICRRAGVTRGALNHHYADLAELFVDALRSAYDMLLSPAPSGDMPHNCEGYLRLGYARVTQPEFKAIVELWLASRNDAEIGSQLAHAIADGSALFDPVRIVGQPEGDVEPEVAAACRTIQEALIGLGLGRAVSGAGEMAHERAVFGVLLELARGIDSRQRNDC
ncbi:MAG: TetR/AcrR family transcriptional regulator [Pseudomonadaceae bacterium]|nr:TetR/AcrR family transcriptional regulator [Pseudomonadaceae bacterium]